MATTIYEPPQVEPRLPDHSGNGGGRNLVSGGGDLRVVQDRPLQPAQTGMWVPLAAITMSFAVLTSALVVRQGTAPDWRHMTLPNNCGPCSRHRNSDCSPYALACDDSCARIVLRDWPVCGLAAVASHRTLSFQQAEQFVLLPAHRPPMINAVEPHRVEPGIAEEYLQARPGRRIAFQRPGQIFPNHGAEATAGSGSGAVGICNAWSRND